MSAWPWRKGEARPRKKEWKERMRARGKMSMLLGNPAWSVSIATDRSVTHVSIFETTNKLFICGIIMAKVKGKSVESVVIPIPH